MQEDVCAEGNSMVISMATLQGCRVGKKLTSLFHPLFSLRQESSPNCIYERRSWKHVFSRIRVVVREELLVNARAC